MTDQHQEEERMGLSNIERMIRKNKESEENSWPSSDFCDELLELCGGLSVCVAAVIGIFLVFEMSGVLTQGSTLWEAVTSGVCWFYVCSVCWVKITDPGRLSDGFIGHTRTGARCICAAAFIRSASIAVPYLQGVSTEIIAADLENFRLFSAMAVVMLAINIVMRHEIVTMYQIVV